MVEVRGLEESHGVACVDQREDGVDKGLVAAMRHADVVLHHQQQYMQSTQAHEYIRRGCRSILTATMRGTDDVPEWKWW